MQQTSNYQFNLVETGDAFSPAPLNENMEKVEAALGFGGQTCRIASGSYVGTDTYGLKNPTTMEFEFKPLWVFITNRSTTDVVAFVRGQTAPRHLGSSYSLTLSWTDNSITFYCSGGVAGQMNDNDTTYYWIALGV